MSYCIRVALQSLVINTGAYVIPGLLFVYGAIKILENC